MRLRPVVEDWHLYMFVSPKTTTMAALILLNEFLKGYWIYE